MIVCYLHIHDDFKREQSETFTDIARMRTRVHVIPQTGTVWAGVLSSERRCAAVAVRGWDSFGHYRMHSRVASRRHARFECMVWTIFEDECTAVWQPDVKQHGLDSFGK